MAPERAELLRRAHVAAEVARRALQSSEPFSGAIDPVIGELYRQSIHWSRRALELPANAAANEPLAADQRVSPWDVVAAGLLQKTAADPIRLAQLERAVESFTFEDFANLEAAECAHLASELRSVAVSLIAELDISKRVVEALWLQRVLRVAFVAALLAVSVFIVAQLRDSAERRRDIAAGRPWHASSVYPVAGCQSPKQQCDDSPDYFFHTQEEANPWVEFDLGSPQRISAVRVDNRKDCCVERAAPMVVQVSTDDHNWKTVARRDAVFTSWLGNFSPTNARWVRLRLEKRAPLHLLGVRILR